jgi:hypothetical protein
LVFVYVTAASGFPGPFLFVFGGLLTRGYAADSDGVADWRPLSGVILLLEMGWGWFFGLALAFCRGRAKVRFSI